MLNGVILLWYLLTVPSVIFVAIDIWRSTPEAKVLKWAFIILTLFTGPIGAFFYVLGCREPLAGTHEQYVATRWRQVLGSTMHCAAGDGIGIIVGAAIGAALTLAFWPDFLLEYALGFGFGWAFFQAFAMRDMAGGSYSKSLRMTFLPELLSMNLLMAGMQLVSRFVMPHVTDGNNPTNIRFWFIMSMALLVGFIFAYPMNWWLVSNNMKHGMLTVRAAAKRPAANSTAAMPMGAPASMPQEQDAMADMDMSSHSDVAEPSTGRKAAMTVLSFVILGAALLLVVLFAQM